MVVSCILVMILYYLGHSILSRAVFCILTCTYPYQMLLIDKDFICAPIVIACKLPFVFNG